MDHGMPIAETRHIGDLGNIVSTDPTGITIISITDSIISLKGGSVANIFGRAFAIHMNDDEFVQPLGNAGPIISCGIIGVCDSSCQETLLFKTLSSIPIKE